MERRKELSRINIPLDDSIDRRELFGGMDQNLRNIEGMFGVTIIQRSDGLLIIEDGDRAVRSDNGVEHAAAILKEMIATIRKGEVLDQQKVGYITDLTENGISYSRQTAGSELDREIICFTHDGKPLRPKTIGQREYVRTIRKKDIVFGIGPAGTGKTYIAVAMAVQAFKNKDVQKIILARPAVEAGENLGFLPGDLRDKLDPYLQPLYDALRDMIPQQKLLNYWEDNTIEIAPLAFMRGRTLDNAFVILDEAQNATSSQLKMFLTRMGRNAKFVITGDITQIDLPRHQQSGLVQAMHILDGINGISFINLDNSDVIRHKLVTKIIRAYDGEPPQVLT